MMNDEACWNEADWKLFRSRLPAWQEAYMARLVKKYLSILNQETPACDRFWQIEESIKRDKKSIGIVLESPRRSMFVLNMMRLVSEEVISTKDLEGFSPRLCEMLKVKVV